MKSSWRPAPIGLQARRKAEYPLAARKPGYDTALSSGAAGPLRRCVGSGESLPVERLIRFVISPDGVLTPDLTAELPGRGLWLTSSRAALEKALAAKAFAKAARRQIAIPRDIAAQIETLLSRRVLDMLGFARKAGQAVCGREKTDALARSGKIGVLLCANDAAPDGKARLERLVRAAAPETCLAGWLSSAELSLAFGRENVIHAAIAKGRMADRFMTEASRLAGFRA